MFKYDLKVDMVVQQVTLPPSSFRISGLIPSLIYCQRSVFPAGFPPLKIMLVERLAMLNEMCMCAFPVMDCCSIQGLLSFCAQCSRTPEAP